MSRNVSRAVLVLLAALTSQVDGAEKKRPAKPVDGADNALDVPYLPERVTGTWTDEWVRMNIHSPKGARNRPCVLVVHGGGYGSGFKDEGIYHDMATRLVQDGFVVANINYILGRGIFPQVFYDFKAAVRFLRANHATYGIDPERIGAWGLSAGGWLSSSAGLSDAGDIMVTQSNGIDDLWPAERRASALGGLVNNKRKLFAASMDDPHPAWGDHSSRLSAIMIDWGNHSELVSPDDPSIGTFVGPEGQSGWEAPATAAGVDFTAIVVPNAKQGETSLHCPNLDQAAPLPGGGTGTLRDLVHDYLRRALGPEARHAAPEFRPNHRRFTDTIEVTALGASPRTEVRYTTDGSDPTPGSPVWKGALRLQATTTIKAIALGAGLRPSGIVTATYTKGEAPPTISGPGKLPPGKVGSPYAATFTVAGSRAATWQFLCNYSPADWRSPVTFSEFTGLAVDGGKGTISGTPTTAGTYLIHVQAAWGLGQPADSRAYQLIIAP
jgi:hypothetical protein